MNLRYDEDFLENAVVLCASGRRPGAPALQVRRFHHEREKLYRLLDADERNAAFFRLHLEWFREWGLEKVLTDIVAAFPILSRSLDVLVFRQARGKNEEGGELYVNADGARHSVVALRSERWLRAAELEGFLNHELTHLADMVDPGFAYSPILDAGGATAMQQRLVSERYRVLWDVTIDGRLNRAGRATVAGREQRLAEFERTYSFWPPERRAAVFASLWGDPAPAHAPLLALASDPRDVRAGQRPAPGAPCPLCGFPTFNWLTAEALPPRTIDAIRAEFPAWTPDQGLCQRCGEVYEAARIPIPANLCV